jgi:glutamine synthetase
MIKYGHSEVGNIIGENLDIEQHEIEFLPLPIEDAADQIVMAKWILRMICYKYGLTVSFAPKILLGHAGSGLHIHTKLVKDGKNMMIDGGKLSDTAKKVIAGYLTLAPSLTAFGNNVPTSFFRLVPHQEAPTNICWGDRNRSALVRVPLGWLGVGNMIKDANPGIEDEEIEYSQKQTVEFRCPDGSANIYLLLAGLATAARYGLEMENSLEIAKKLYVDVNIFLDEYKTVRKALPKLPSSCWASSEALLKDRHIYQKHDVFTPMVIDGIAKQLKTYLDENLSSHLYGKEEEIKKLVNEFLHCS